MNRGAFVSRAFTNLTFEGEVDYVTTVKQDEIVGASSTITLSNLDPLKVVVSDSNGKIDTSFVTTEELDSLLGIRSNVQSEFYKVYDWLRNSLANQSNIYNGSNIILVNSNDVYVNSSLLVGNNVVLHYENTGIEIKDAIKLLNSNSSNAGYWKIKNDVINNMSSDLIFHSNNGTTITFTDDFTPDVLNFTGKHRCVSNTITNTEEHVGKIVVATGTYEDLDNNTGIVIDEAIPRVELASKYQDKRVFGVVGGFDTNKRFALGNIVFNNSNNVCNRIVVNSVGEGGIWVCDSNGPLENGDFITSSSISGYGVKQEDDLVHSYTMAKITCDCAFDVNSTIYKCLEFEHDGKTYRKAFVGCIYMN
jgi:hypothetical protein